MMSYHDYIYTHTHNTYKHTYTHTHAYYVGVFFTLETKESDIWVQGLRCGGHSFASVNDFTRIKLECYTKEGDVKGSETDKSAWTEVANILRCLLYI